MSLERASPVKRIPACQTPFAMGPGLFNWENPDFEILSGFFVFPWPFWGGQEWF